MSYLYVILKKCACVIFCCPDISKETMSLISPQ